MTGSSIISDPFQVTVLMGVFNGAAYLPAQLHSIADQTGTDWRLICSDDGSTDASATQLRTFADRYPGRVTIKPGPRRGFSTNYMRLIADLPDTPGFVAFADQDDVWLPAKLWRARQFLPPKDDKPALYCGRRIYWTPATGARRASPQRHRPCILKNALVENTASGNTIVLNPAAARLAQRAAQRTGDVFAHDWWLYLLLTACGGTVYFDNGPPQILYRQHGKNAIGEDRGLRRQWARKSGVLRGELAQRVEQNLDALAAIETWLTPDARQTLAQFCAARTAPLGKRLIALRKAGAFRQTRRGTLGLWGAAGLGRV